MLDIMPLLGQMIFCVIMKVEDGQHGEYCSEGGAEQSEVVYEFFVFLSYPHRALFLNNRRMLCRKGIQIGSLRALPASGGEAKQSQVAGIEIAAVAFGSFAMTMVMFSTEQYAHNFIIINYNK